MLKQFTYEVEYTSKAKFTLLAGDKEMADENLQSEIEWNNNPGSLVSFKVLSVKEEARDEVPSHTY